MSKLYAGVVLGSRSLSLLLFLDWSGNNGTTNLVAQTCWCSRLVKVADYWNSSRHLWAQLVSRYESVCGPLLFFFCARLWSYQLFCLNSPAPFPCHVPFVVAPHAVLLGKQCRHVAELRPTWGLHFGLQVCQGISTPRSVKEQHFSVKCRG